MRKVEKTLSYFLLRALKLIIYPSGYIIDISKESEGQVDENNYNGKFN